jgi:hypothetical protein
MGLAAKPVAEGGDLAQLVDRCKSPGAGSRTRNPVIVNERRAALREGVCIHGQAFCAMLLAAALVGAKIDRASMATATSGGSRTQIASGAASKQTSISFQPVRSGWHRIRRKACSEPRLDTLSSSCLVCVSA